jgi:hypothetical protein
MRNMNCCSKCLSVIALRFCLKARPAALNNCSQAALAGNFGKAVCISRKMFECVNSIILSSDDVIVVVLMYEDRIVSGVTVVPPSDLNVKKSSSISGDVDSSVVQYRYIQSQAGAAAAEFFS